MPFCPSCKSFVPPGVPTCPKDGTSLNSKAAPPAPLTGPRPSLQEQTKEVPAEPVMTISELPAEDDHTPNEEPVMSTMRMEALDLSSQPELELLAETDEPTPADASMLSLELIEESFTPSEVVPEEDAIAAAQEPKTENEEEPKLPENEEPSIKELPAPPPPSIGVAVAEMKRDEDLAATSRLPVIVAPLLKTDDEAPKPLSLPMPIGLPLPASMTSTPTPIPPPPMPLPLAPAPIAMPAAPPPVPFAHTPPPIPLSTLSSPPPLPPAGAPSLPPPVPFSSIKREPSQPSLTPVPPAPPTPPKNAPPILTSLADIASELPTSSRPSLQAEAPSESRPSAPPGRPSSPSIEISPSASEARPAAPPGRPLAPPSSESPSSDGRPAGPPGRPPGRPATMAPSSAATPPEGVAPRSVATPPEGTPAVGHSMRTPAEGSPAVGDGGARPGGPPGRPPGRPAPAPMPTKAPLPMRAAPLPARPQKTEDASGTRGSVSSKPLAPAVKLDYAFPPAKSAPFPEISTEWTIRVPSDAQEPGNIVACAGADDIALCWHDRRQKKRYEVYAARFGQRSQKRGPGVSIVPKPGPALNPAMAWDGAGYGLFWQDGRKGNADIYYRHLDKEGKPDGKELRLTDGKAESMNPRVLWNGSEFICAYAKQIGDVCEIYLMRVNRDGSLIGAGEMRISEGNRNALNPSMVYTGDSYGLAWEDFRNDRGHVYFCRLSTDGGRFSYDQRVSIGKNGASNTPSIAHNGDNFAIAWIEWPDDMRQNNAIHFAKVTNRGNLIGEIHRVVTEKAIQGPPTLLWRESEYVVIWQDSREGAPQIFAQRIDADGVRIGGESRLSNGEGASLYPWAVPGPDNQIGVAWHNETPETGGYEIFGTMLSLSPLPE